MATVRHSARIGMAILVALCLLFLVFTSFELLKDWLGPALSLWQSHCLTIGFGSIMGGAAVFFAYRHCLSLRCNLEERTKERARLEDALLNAEERYRALFEQSIEAVVLIEPENGEVVDSNPLACLSLGYSREELDRLRFDTLEIAGHDGKFSQHAAQALKRGSDTFELRMRTRTGEIRDLRMGVRRIVVRESVFLLAAWQDITEQKVMRERILDQYQLLNTLIQTIPCPLFYKNAEGKYTGCNRAFEEFLGKSREEIIGKNVFELAPREIADEYFRRDRELFTHPGRQVYEWKVKTPQGNRDVIFHKATFNDAEGRVDGLVGVILDITEHRHTETQLARAIAHHEALLDTAPVAVFTVDANRNVTNWNRTAETLTGYPASEILHRPCSVFAREACCDVCRLFDTANAEPIVDRKCTICHRDGHRIRIIKSARLIHDPSGHVVGGIEVFQEDRERG
jgi:PAS domain S-box-containing protein